MEEKHDNPWNHGHHKNRSSEAILWGVIVLSAAAVLYYFTN